MLEMCPGRSSTSACKWQAAGDGNVEDVKHRSRGAMLRPGDAYPGRSLETEGAGSAGRSTAPAILVG
jgi:hypothetical protein